MIFLKTILTTGVILRYLSRTLFILAISSPLQASNSESIGKYTDGHIISSVSLKRNATGIQTMRPSAAKNFGHKSLESFIYDLGKNSLKSGFGQLMIGDLSSEHGGLLPGHASHQNGLDVDIWFYRPSDHVNNLPNNERDPYKFPHFLNPATNEFYPNMWTKKLDHVLKLAAEDKRVARIFVNPGIKKRLCKLFPQEQFLKKIRPWYRHHEHFHVRLNCPKDSPSCIDQQKPTNLDCSGNVIDWWFSKEFRREYQRRYGKVH